MNEKFKKYLEQQFRMIAPSKEAMEYRQEVYANLCDRAHEFKIKGMTDEEAIYDLCIDSLGDFKSTLQDFENRLEEVKRVAPKISAVALSGIAIALFVVIAYLIVSFVTHAWDKTWLILVGGVFAGVIAGSVFGIIKITKKSGKKKFLPIRALAQVILVLSFVFLFLILQILVHFQYSWMTFLIMVIGILITDTAIAFSYNSKSRIPMLLAAVIVTCVMVYVILGVTGAVAWHPFWLIIIGGVVIDLGILIAALMGVSKKKEKALAEKKAENKEDYYTMWKD